MFNDNVIVIQCLEAQTYYTAMSEKNRKLAKEAWLSPDIWDAKSKVQSLIAEAFIARAEELTKK